MCLPSVLKPPVLLHNLTDYTVNVSSSVTLSCPAKGIPPPTITWYKDKHVLLQGAGNKTRTGNMWIKAVIWCLNFFFFFFLPPPPGIVILPEAGTLHIDRITVEDQGLYTCQVTNKRGTTESSAYIWVKSEYLSTSCVFQESWLLIGCVYLRREDCGPPYMVTSQCLLFSLL